MARLENIWKINISFLTEFKLYKSLVVFILLCELGILDTPGCDKKKNAEFENISPTGSAKPVTVDGARSKILWAHIDLSSPLLSVGNCYDLTTSHSITTSASPSYVESALKADASGVGNAKAGQTT